MEKYVILRHLATHIRSYVQQKGYSVAAMSASRPAPSQTATRRRLEVLRQRYDEAMHSAPPLPDSSDSGSTGSGSVSVFKASPDKSALKAVQSPVSEGSQGDSALPEPPPPLSPVGRRRGVNAILASEATGDLTASSAFSDAEQEQSDYSLRDSYGERAVLRSQPVTATLQAAIDEKGSPRPPGPSSAEYLQKYDTVFGREHEPHRRRYIPSSDIKGEEPTEPTDPEIPPYLCRYLSDDTDSTMGNYHSKIENSVSKIDGGSTSNRNVSGDPTAKPVYPSTASTDDLLWVRRGDATTRRVDGGDHGEDLSKSSVDAIMDILEREGVHHPAAQSHQETSMHSTGIDYSNKSNRMVLNQKAQRRSQALKAAATTRGQNSVLNDSYNTVNSMRSTTSGRNAAAYPGHMFCTCCKRFGEKKTCCGLPAATVYHPHLRSRGGEKRGGVVLDTWPWQIEADISYERVSGARLRSNNEVYEYVDTNFMSTAATPLSLKFNGSEILTSQRHMDYDREARRAPSDTHHDIYLNAKKQDSSMQKKSVSDLFNFQTKQSSQSPHSSIVDVKHRGGRERCGSSAETGSSRKSPGQSVAYQEDHVTSASRGVDNSLLATSLNGYSAREHDLLSPRNPMSSSRHSTSASCNGNAVRAPGLWSEQELFHDVHANYIDTLQSYRHSMEGDMLFMNDQIRRIEKQPV